MQVVDEAISQAIVNALSDEYCRKILAVTARQGKTPEQICQELTIPISTCYRRIHELRSQSILRISKIELANGKKVVYYKSAYSNLEVKFALDGFSIEATLNNTSPDERLVEMISDMRIQSLTIHDCDLCQARVTSCKILQVGESKTQVFACANCAAKAEKGQIPSVALHA
jgi:predicted transcriptional regulator